MSKEEFIKELKQAREYIAPCLADKDKDCFVGEFSRLDLEVFDRALLIAIQVTDLDMKGRK